MSSSTIHSLNDDCLESLFTQFTLLEWITVLRRVCTRWNVLIDRMHQSAFVPFDNSPQLFESSTQNEVYLFKRFHFEISFDFTVQSKESCLYGIFQSFWNTHKDKNRLQIRGNDVDDDVLNTIVKDKLESIGEMGHYINDWVNNEVGKSRLWFTHISLYRESNLKTVQRFNALNTLLSVAVFWNKSFGNHELDKIEEKCSKDIASIAKCIVGSFKEKFPFPFNCTQIDSPDFGPFESLKLYREFAAFSDGTNSKANLMGHQITELVHQMRPEGLSEKFENYRNLYIQTCNQMYKLKLSLCMPSLSVTAAILRNCPCLNNLNLKFKSLDLPRFDQMFWKALFGLSQLNTLRITYANIDLSDLVQLWSGLVSPVRTLTLERVEMVTPPNHKGQSAAQLIARTLLRLFPDAQHVTLMFTEPHLNVLTRYYLRQFKPEVENLEIKQENSYRYN